MCATASILHAERIRPPDAAAASLRRDLIDALAKRFYEDERGTVISNGLSTTMIGFPSDLRPHRLRHLNGKIEDAMSYATAFRDIDELNALKRIPPQSLQDNYAALGLYLYFEDECSRLKHQKTFLTELREANAGLPADEITYYPHKLLGRAQDVLKEMDMLESHGHILDQWYKDGSFIVQGERNGRIPGSLNVEGAYARLAEAICKQEKVLSMDIPISYSLGNKEHIRNMSAEDAYAYTNSLTLGKYSNPHSNVHPRIVHSIHEGRKERRRRIHEIIQSRLGLPAAEETNASYHSDQIRAAPAAREMLDYLPNGMLEMLHRQGYSIAYANAPTIDTCYPVGKIPGQTAGEAARGNKGDRLPHYQTIFISNGYRNKHHGDDIAQDSELRYRVAAQSLAHEAFHNVIDLLDTKDRQALEQAVKAVHHELHAHAALPAYCSDHLKTIDSNTLREVIDHTSSLYNYTRLPQSDTSWMEVACNVYGLMQTEYKPDATTHNPYQDIPSLGRLKDRIDVSMEKALKKCRRLYYYTDLPNPGHATRISPC